jgi:UDP-glucose 4-epimerase
VTESSAESIAPRGERILITGGAGFIGSTLAARIVEDNELVLLDTFARNSLRYHSGLEGHPNLTIHKGSVLDPEAVAAAMDGATQVVHCAAIAGIDSVGKRPTKTMEINVIGTWRVLEAAVAAGNITRFIEFSTSEVFGQRAWRVSEQDNTVVAPVGESRWTYAVSKLATEHMAHAYHQEYGLPTVCLRPFNCYGPRQVGEGAIHYFIKQAVAGQDLTVHNDGTQIRAWCYVDDLVEALCRSLVMDAAAGESFNIGNPGATTTIRGLAEEVVRLTGGHSAIRFVERAGPDVELRVPNVDKAADLLDFTASTDLTSGLLQTIDWFRAQVGASP